MQTTNEASARVASPSSAVTLADREIEITKFVLPIYYSNLPISKEEFKAAYDCWKVILNNRSPHFLKMKATDPTCTYENCNEYFFHIFYNRFFDIHPSARVLFTKPINKQGSFLMRFITLCLDAWEDDDKWDKTLINLTNIHNRMGIKAIECNDYPLIYVRLLISYSVDGINGEVLFYSIKECIGSAAYTETVHKGWVKIYSRMLMTIVPRVVRFELGNTETADQISKARSMREASGTVFTTKGKGNEASVSNRDPTATSN